MNRIVVNADDAGLKRIGGKPSFLNFIQEIIRIKAFIITDAKYRSFRTTRDYKYWRFWLIAQPLLDAAVYGLIFGIVLKTSRGIENYPAFLVIGLTFFGFMSRLTTSGLGLIKTSQNFIRNFQFPRAAVVLSQGIRYFLDNLPPALMAIIFAICLQWEKGLSLSLIFIVPVYVLIHIFGLGLTFIVARATALVPDLKVLVNLAIRIWFYSSGIFFSLEKQLPEGLLRDLLLANPATHFLSMCRGIVLDQTIPGLNEWIFVFSISLATFTLGLYYFWGAEERYNNV